MRQCVVCKIQACNSEVKVTLKG